MQQPALATEQRSSAAFGRRAVVSLVASTAVILALCLGLRALVLKDVRPGERLLIFWHLFLQHEPAAAVLAFAIVVTSIFLARVVEPAFTDRMLKKLALEPGVFIGAITLLLSVAAVLVYRRHALSMDEYAPLFQARAFAAGSLWGQVPPALLPRIVPVRSGDFLEASLDGRIISSYWPGFALLLAPFALLRIPWLLNPLLGGAALWAIWHVSRKLLPGEAAPGWAVVLAAASPAFLVNAISFYSMGAHLLLNLLFVALALEPTARRLALAGLIGSFALTLHNPVPHLLFALPWIVWIGRRRGGARNLAALFAGYLPFSLLLGLGWLGLRSRINGAAAVAAVDLAGGLARLAFRAPDVDLLLARAAGLLELVLWAAPGLVLFAVWGAVRQCRGVGRDPRLLVLILSATGTLAGYLFVPFSQGHGWGYRYFHSAWGVLPVLAAALLTSEGAEVASLSRVVVLSALLTLVFGTGFRFREVRAFIDGHLAQIPAAASRDERQVVFVRRERGYYSQDLVQNDPFLEGDRWVLLSRGEDADEEFMRHAFPGAKKIARNDVATVWAVP